MNRTYLAISLQPGERIICQGGPHPAFLIPHLGAAAAFALALAIAIRRLGLPASYPAAWWILAIPALYLGSQVLTFITCEAALTSDRMLTKSGWVSRRISEISLSKIESTSIDQGFLGRMFGFADLAVTGSGGHSVTALAISNVMAFRAAIQNAIACRG